MGKSMTRVALGVEYNGAGYCGWQYQPHCVSVQQVLEAALRQVAGHTLRVSCAGRTDAGVHAIAQVVHFDTSAERSPHNWVFGCNANLPDDVAVVWAQAVSETFHARYSAVQRAYRYVILNRPMRPGRLNTRVSWEYRPLQLERMQAAAQDLVGEHDFSAYRALSCQAKSPIRTIYRLEVARHGDMVVIDVAANGFLHHMVRNIAGVLMTIGAGEQHPKWAQQLLEHRDRRLGGVTASPDGLYFITAYYPDDYNLPVLESPTLLW